MARIVFDAGAEACLAQHFDIEAGALLQTRCFEQLTINFQFCQPFFQLGFDQLDGVVQALLCRNPVLGRVDIQALPLPQHFARKRIDLSHALDLVAKEFDTYSHILVGREYLQHIPAHAETPANEVSIIALILDFRQVAQNLLPPSLFSHLQGQYDLPIFFRAAQAKDAGNRGDNQHIAPLKQTACRGEAQLLDLFVEHALFFDVGVGTRDVGLWLVVVVVGDKILDGVVWKELFILTVELRCQGFVRRKHQCRLLYLLYNFRYRICLAAAGYPQQRLIPVVIPYALNQFCNCFRLIARRLKRRFYLEFWHNLSSSISYYVDYRIFFPIASSLYHVYSLITSRNLNFLGSGGKATCLGAPLLDSLCSC